MGQELALETDKGKVLIGMYQTEDDLMSNTMTIYALTQIPRDKVMDDPELPQKMRDELVEVLARATKILAPKEDNGSIEGSRTEHQGDAPAG